MKRLFLISTLASTLILSAGLTLAADQDQDRDRLQAQQQDQIYGSQLMTLQERLEFRTRMRDATSAEEREQIRMEHHKRMKERAKESGVTLPEEPPAVKGYGGMSPGGGMGGKGR